MQKENIVTCGRSQRSTLLSSGSFACSIMTYHQFTIVAENTRLERSQRRQCVCHLFALPLSSHSSVSKLCSLCVDLPSRQTKVTYVSEKFELRCVDNGVRRVGGGESRVASRLKIVYRRPNLLHKETLVSFLTIATTSSFVCEEE